MKGRFPELPTVRVLEGGLKNHGGKKTQKEQLQDDREVTRSPASLPGPGKRHIGRVEGISLHQKSHVNIDT